MPSTRAMALLREWSCMAHGPFESRTGKCPRGCSKRFVVQEFRTPVGIKSGRTKVADNQLRGLAADFGLTNIKAQHEGESVMQALRRSDPTTAMPTWGKVDHAAPGFSQREGERAKTYNPGYAGVAMDSMKPSFRPIQQMTRVVGRAEGKVE